jgi:CRISPR/Cas system Type II protein with McrA/HNH and RuvC-like nuclease domain
MGKLACSSINITQVAKSDIEYDIALDIGTGSVGWCAADKEGALLQRKGKNAWGVAYF